MSNYCWHTISNNNCQTCRPTCQRPCNPCRPYNPCRPPMPPQIQNLYRMLNQLSSQVVALQKQNNVLQTQNAAVKSQLDAFIAAVNAVTPQLDNASTATNPTVASLQQAIYNAIVALNSAITAAGGTPSTTPTTPTPTPPVEQPETYTINTTGLATGVTPTITFDGKPVTNNQVTDVPSKITPAAFTATAPGYTTGTITVDPTTKTVTIPFTENKVTYTVNTTGLPSTAEPDIYFMGRPVVNKTVSALPSDVVPQNFTATATGYTAGTAQVDQTTKTVTIPFTEDEATYTVTITGLPNTVKPTITFNGQPIETTFKALPSQVKPNAFTATATGYTAGAPQINQATKTVTIPFTKQADTTPTA